MKPCPFENLIRQKRKSATMTPFEPGVASDFYFACSNGDYQRVLDYLNDENGPGIEVLNELQPNGSTALHAATYRNHVEIVRLLLERGCPRTTLNRFGLFAYQEANTDEMQTLYKRKTSTNRFHELEPETNLSIFIAAADASSTDQQYPSYVEEFRTMQEVQQYSLHLQTKVMWLAVYHWFSQTFRTSIEPEHLRIDEFDLCNHADFQKFLTDNFSLEHRKTIMGHIASAKARNSIEPLITLYTGEEHGFYKVFNKALAKQNRSEHKDSQLCDRFLMEFFLRRPELRQRSFTGVVFRGVTIHRESLDIYRRAADEKRLGILSFKALTSTSTNPSVAMKFFENPVLDNDHIRVLFVFEINHVSSKIFNIADISEYGRECEVIILPGTLFSVEEIEENPQGQLIKIYLKQVHISISVWQKLKNSYVAGQQSVLNKH